MFSSSGIYYSRHKASTKCELSTKRHAQKLTVIARNEVYPGIWNVSLKVLPEKIAGVCLVENEIHSTM